MSQCEMCGSSVASGDLFTNQVLCEQCGHHGEAVKGAPEVEYASDVEQVPTSEFPHMGYTFPYFNPAQSMVVPYVDEESNVVCAFRTSAGKTVCGELFMDRAIRMGRKAIYLSPLKALTSEKHREWTSPGHAFSKYKVEILTGDFQYTQEKVRRMNEAHIIAMTTEMLDSKARNPDSRNSAFLRGAGVVIVDEAHVLGIEGRGDVLEDGLIRLSECNPTCRIVFLSATIGNSEDFEGWLTRLNGMVTRHLRSDYRPIPLDVHYSAAIPYDEPMVKKAIEVFKEDPGMTTLFFVHSKKVGRMLVERLSGLLGVEVPFHNRELEFEERDQVERDFRERRLMAVVATSTVAFGVNFPARRVIIVNTQYGPGRPVQDLTIWQMIGRSGRMGYDPRGEAHVILPDGREAEEERRLAGEPLVFSQMVGFPTLAFHSIASIHQGLIQKPEDIAPWYAKTFASFTGEDPGKADLCAELRKIGAVEEDADGKLVCTAIGEIASRLYYSPVTLAQWVANFDRILPLKFNDGDLAIAWALTQVDWKDGDKYVPVVPQMIEETMEELLKYGLPYHPKKIPLTAAIYMWISEWTLGKDALSKIYFMAEDAERMVAAIRKAGLASGAFSRPEEYWDELYCRLKYGVKADAAVFVALKGVAKKRARELCLSGLNTLEDLVNPQKKGIVVGVLGKSLAAEVAEEARKILLKETKSGKTLAARMHSKNIII